MTIETDSYLPAPPPPDGAAPPSSRKNGFERIAGVLFSPGETFRDIVARPDFLVPLLVIVVLAVVGSVVVAPRVDFESAFREQFAEQNPNMSDSDVERAARFSGALAKAFLYFSPLVNLAFFAAIAGILLLAFRLFGGEGNYKQAFSVTLYAWMPMVIAGVVSMIILIARGSVDAQELQNLVMSNPGFLVDMKEQRVLFALLSSIDIFVIWTLALFIIGFANVSKMRTGKAAAVILSLWCVVLLFKIGSAAIAAARLKS